MAGSVNKVILVGNLGADPDVRSLNNGGEVVNLSIATSERWNDREGQRQERTEWHRVVIFNENLGKVAKQYLRKGSSVYLEGQIQTRKWQDNEGKDRYSTEIVLQRFRGELVLLGGREGGSGSSGASGSWGDEARGGGFSGGQSSSGGYGQQNPRDAAPTRGPASFDNDLDDDVPF